MISRISGDNSNDSPLPTPPDKDHRFFALHGDPVELPSGSLKYCCRVCDIFADAAHFKSHAREAHLRAYEWSRRCLENFACRLWVMRPDFAAADENLVERGLWREQQRKNDAAAERDRDVQHFGSEDSANVR
jgi:hypothetical protein